MQEYISDAVVLSREPSGELDLRISLFTKNFGKISCKAKSARKIASKLSGHLEPGNLAKVRIIEKNGFQLADALKNKRVVIGEADLKALDRLLHEREEDYGLWALISSGEFSWEMALRLLGWDPEAANCARCGGPAEAFLVPSQEFFCKNCSLGMNRNEVIYL